MKKILTKVGFDTLSAGQQLAIGSFGACVAALFGGWDMAIQTLLLFMAVDYITGLLVAGVFKKSTKTKNGALESKAGWKGLCRKGMTLFFVLIACRLDALIGVDFIRDAVVIGYVANESISIIENAGLMGVPIPGQIQKAIEILKQKSEEPVKE